MEYSSTHSLALHLDGVSGQLHAPDVLPPGKSPWYPMHKRLGGHQSRSGHGGEEKNSQPLPRLEPPIIQPVAQRYTTELFGPGERWEDRVKLYSWCGSIQLLHWGLPPK
jgi:hypothetical protein